MTLPIDLPKISKADRIPRRLHQICFPDTSGLPDAVILAIDALKALHPDWTHQIYDAAAAEIFIDRVYGQEMTEVFLSIDPAYPAARADLLRYLLCYAEGGVYIDLKSTTTRPFDQVLRPDDQFLLNQRIRLENGQGPTGPHPELQHIPGGEFTIWCLASTPGHPFLKAVIERAVATIRAYSPFRDGVGKDGVLRVTGPIMFTLAVYPLLERHPHRRVILDPDEGLRWTIYDRFDAHRGSMGQHYSDQTVPVVRGSAVERAAALAVYGHILPKGRWFTGAVRRRLGWR